MKIANYVFAAAVTVVSLVACNGAVVPPDEAAAGGPGSIAVKMSAITYNTGITSIEVEVRNSTRHVAGATCTPTMKPRPADEAEFDCGPIEDILAGTYTVTVNAFNGNRKIDEIAEYRNDHVVVTAGDITNLDILLVDTRVQQEMGTLPILEYVAGPSTAYSLKTSDIYAEVGYWSDPADVNWNWKDNCRGTFADGQETFNGQQFMVKKQWTPPTAWEGECTITLKVTKRGGSSTDPKADERYSQRTLKLYVSNRGQIEIEGTIVTRPQFTAMSLEQGTVACEETAADFAFSSQNCELESPDTFRPGAYTFTAKTLAPVTSMTANLHCDEVSDFNYTLTMVAGATATPNAWTGTFSIPAFAITGLPSGTHTTDTQVLGCWLNVTAALTVTPDNAQGPTTLTTSLPFAFGVEP